DLNTALHAVNLFQSDPADSTGAQITLERPFQASEVPLLAGRTRVGCSLCKGGAITSRYVGKCFVEKGLAALAVGLGENFGTPSLTSPHSRSPDRHLCDRAKSFTQNVEPKRPERSFLTRPLKTWLSIFPRTTCWEFFLGAR